MRLALFLALLISVFDGFAAPRPLTVKRMGLEQGLSQVTARVIAQDGPGQVWIGTESGLNIHDGAHVRHLRHDPEDPRSLSDNYIRALLAGPGGDMWVGTMGGGLNRWLAAEERFERYPFGTPAGLPSAEVEALLQTTGGTLWIGHGGGLSRLDSAKGSYTHFSQSSDGPLGAVRALAQTPDGAIWLGGQGGLWRLSPDTTQIERVPTLATKPILALRVASDGNLWVGTETAGLHRVDPASRQVQSISGGPGPEVTAIAEDPQGAIWFATWAGGISRIDPASGHIETWNNAAPAPTSLSSTHVVSLMVDHSGVLWAGTFDAGANLVMPYGSAFEHHAYDVTRAANGGLVWPMVWAFAEGPDGAIWVGTQRGMNRYDAQLDRAEVYLADGGRCSGLGLGRDVRAILPEGERLLWLALADGGLVRLDPATCQHRIWRKELTTATRARLLLRDKQGMLWVGTDKGLNRLDPASGLVTHYTAQGQPGSLPHNRIRSLYQDAQGTLWVGTSGGLSRWEPPTQEDGGAGQFTTWRAADGLLSDNDVRAIHRDEDGILWLATGMGLTRLDLQQRRARFFYEKQGLSNNTLYTAIPDGPDLWISSNDGLTRFNRQTLEATRFHRGDGLQSSEFNFNAWLRTRAGDLLLGGNGGFNRLHIDRLGHPVPAPRLQLLYQADGAARLQPTPQSAVPGTDALLELEGNGIRVVPQVLHYLNSQRNGWRYRLLGSRNEHWKHAAPGQLEVLYDNLSPGTYRFQAVGYTGGGVESGPPQELAFRVLPPLWLRPWAIALEMLLFVGLAWALAGLRTRTLRGRATRMQAEIDSKTREISDQNERLNQQATELARLLDSQSDFYRRVAHELKTPLSLITLPLDQLRHTTQGAEAPGVDNALATLVRGVERLELLVTELTRAAFDPRGADLAWTQQQTFCLGAFLTPMAELYRQAAQARGTALHTAPLPDAAVTLHRAVLEDVLHNLLSNAVKYTLAGGTITLAVELNSESSALRVTVSDTGPGLTPEECSRIFEAGYRTAQATASGTGGHGQGLHICHSRLLAVGGSIVVCSESGKGCVFSAEIPATWSCGEASRPLGTATLYPNTAPGDERPQLLVVEDDPDLQIALFHTLEPHYALRLAANVADALAQAREHLPDLIVCDRMLPDGDGLSVLDQLRHDQDTSHIPIVLLTAMADQHSQQQGWQNLADDYITKPFDPQTLRLRIDSHLANRRRTRAWALAQLAQLTQFAGAPGEAAPTLAAPGTPEEAIPGPATNVPPLSHVDAQYLARLESTVFSLLPQGGCDLEAVAQRMGQSTRTLQRKLQALYGCGFSDYVAELQLRQAKALLREGASAKRAALEAGYSSPSYMGRVFRKRLGCTPSEYQSGQPGSE
jgi:ligand-binding sensor domain-containing protein/signal transduction histidine kinase/CheY-like chemotaxis protein